jgi:hypothetical protein
VIDPATANNVDLKDIRVVKKVGGTIDDTELVNGLILTQNVVKTAGGPTRMEKAKIGLIQFQLSPPKPDVCINLHYDGFCERLAKYKFRWRTKLLSTIIDRWTRFLRKSDSTCSTSARRSRNLAAMFCLFRNPSYGTLSMTSHCISFPN